MNQVMAKFAALKSRRQKALVTYVMGGDPQLSETPRILEMLAGAGADLIEVGIPFSDPIADGPVIQAAGHRSLENGCTVGKLLATLKQAIANLDIPVVLMTYYNSIYRRGLERFMTEAQAAGVAGLIIPDLLPDDSETIRRLAEEHEIGMNFLIAPTSVETRIKQADLASTGFIYAVSVRGITGVRNQLPVDLGDFMGRVKANTTKPVAIGFGIATPEQVRTVAPLADGVIVGSAVVQSIAADPSLQSAGNLVRSLREALDELA